MRYLRALVGTLAGFALTFTLTFGLSQPACANDTFPSHPVHIVVPYGAGGGTDLVARAFARALSDYWHQNVIVQNLPGADGIVGTQHALLAPPDGYTLIFQLSTFLMWKATQEDTHDLAAQMRLISLIQSAPLSFAVSSKFSGNTFVDFVAYCKKKATSCSWATATRYAQLIGTQLMDVAGLKHTVHVTYKGGAAMTYDLFGGRVDMTIPSVASAHQFMQNGQMKLLAVGSSKRFALLPQVPTLIEQGYPVHGASWYGFMVNKQVPESVFQQIVNAVHAVSTDPRLIATIENGFGQPVFNSPQIFKAEAEAEQKQLDALIAKYPFDVN